MSIPLPELPPPRRKSSVKSPTNHTSRNVPPNPYGDPPFASNKSKAPERPATANPYEASRSLHNPSQRQSSHPQGPNFRTEMKPSNQEPKAEIPRPAKEAPKVLPKKKKVAVPSSGVSGKALPSPPAECTEETPTAAGSPRSPDQKSQNLSNRQPAAVKRSGKSDPGSGNNDTGSSNMNPGSSNVNPGSNKSSVPAGDRSSVDGARPARKPVDLSQIPKDISGLSVCELADCLEQLNTGKYSDDFQKNCIDGTFLRSLESEERMAEMLVEFFGMKPLEVHKLWIFTSGEYRPKM